MTDFRAPIQDMLFTLYDVLDYEKHCSNLPSGEDVCRDIVEAILKEGAKFAENILAPLNAVGDEFGCQWRDGAVVTPPGFKEAYRQYVAAGWPAMTHETEYGGQGLPESLGTILNELCGTANWSWEMYPGLSHGAMNTLEMHGTKEQKRIYLTKLVSGAWTGTMCLTEAHCGTDLGLLKTNAQPNKDGSYAITGTKIFISAGEHDLAENIVHIVLARMPDAPAGTRGISLFIVPKIIPDENGELGVSNTVSCGAIEKKMGIHGNSTCVLNFDGAKGFLIGPRNRGLHCMFTFMNSARLGTAIQGVAAAELGYQKSLRYAKERLQMRALSGAQYPEKPADPIIVHPDVRRMLLTQKAFAEGGRMLLYYSAILVDIELTSKEKQTRKNAKNLLALLTPIAKAFLTEVGFECANHALQIFGGHGYIREWGVEQNVRDVRVSTLYEGTTGIQALDLLGRKVLKTHGELLKPFNTIICNFCLDNKNAQMSEFVDSLEKLNNEWVELSVYVGEGALRDFEEIGAASVDYVMYSGYVTLAYFWARAAKTAMEKMAIEQEDLNSQLYVAKIKTARFYFLKILPRTRSLVKIIRAGAGSLMDFELDEF